MASFTVDNTSTYRYHCESDAQRSLKSSSIGHDCVEILSSNVSVLVEVRLLENLVDLLICQSLSQLFSYHFELLSSDFSLSKEIDTFFWKSNDLKTFSISARECVSPSFPVAKLRKAANVNPPTCSVSRSFRTLQTNLLLAANPKLTKAFFSSTGSTTPLPSLSKISKAVLISRTSSIETVGETQSSAAHSFLTGLVSCPFLDWGWFLLLETGAGFPLATLIVSINNKDLLRLAVQIQLSKPKLLIFSLPSKFRCLSDRYRIGHGQVNKSFQ